MASEAEAIVPNEKDDGLSIIVNGKRYPCTNYDLRWGWREMFLKVSFDKSESEGVLEIMRSMYHDVLIPGFPEKGKEELFSLLMRYAEYNAAHGVICVSFGSQVDDE